MDTQAYLSSASFPVEKESEIDPDFAPADVVIGIAACIKADQFETLVEIKPDGIGVAGLRFQNNGAPFLQDGNFLCLIHQPLSDAFPSKRFAYP